MKRRVHYIIAALILIQVCLPIVLSAQVTRADYERAANLGDKFRPLALNIIDGRGWIDKTSRFWYRKSVRGGFEFGIADAATQTKQIAFDHEKLAAALAAASGEKIEAGRLPFNSILFVNNEKAIEFDSADWRYSCDLTSYACKRIRPVERRGQGGMTMWERGPAPEAASREFKASPDGQWVARIKNYNVYVRPKDGAEFALSSDGSEGNYYTFASIAWSPDSKKLAAYRLMRGYHRVLQYVESSPADQLQPKYLSMEYAKPGDDLDIDQPVLFNVEEKKQISINNSLFANPYDLSALTWREDSRAFTFEYNQRGHQVYRVIEVDAAAGRPRAVISEEMPTFFCYSGKKYRKDLADGKEVIWMSERDGWNHLYLHDGNTGAVKNQITRGEWVVRSVDDVDEAKRQIYFQASGMFPGKDPYFTYGYRINFDGTGLTRMSEGEGSHNLVYSQDRTYYADTWSRVDEPPITEIRRTADQKLVMQVEKADIQDLIKAGWKAPEVFVAKGRDGKSDIWGVIFRPANVDPKKKYPVVENIYAGPQGSFVPKTFSAYNGMQSLAELGFVVIQVDGMGTSNRSKAFHDISWKNLGDAGFPDRILWHKSVAAKYPYYDITRVGIYGNSAGGQNSLGGMLFHPEFYKVCVSSCGCHDNRMDKIWWNEQWMGWPLGPEYAASSNVDNAYRLEGDLLLVVGEMDTNVDPASTMQVVNALIKANKIFDLLVIPGAGHGSGGTYGERKRWDFFVHNLLGVDSPEWNRVEPKTKK
jgi:dipeptidyl aminopeptidase/acylaminoacyl peptidase